MKRETKKSPVANHSCLGSAVSTLNHTEETFNKPLDSQMDGSYR